MMVVCALLFGHVFVILTLRAQRRRGGGTAVSSVWTEVQLFGIIYAKPFLGMKKLLLLFLFFLTKRTYWKWKCICVTQYSHSTQEGKTGTGKKNIRSPANELSDNLTAHILAHWTCSNYARLAKNDCQNKMQSIEMVLAYDTWIRWICLKQEVDFVYLQHRIFLSDGGSHRFTLRRRGWVGFSSC